MQKKCKKNLKNAKKPQECCEFSSKIINPLELLGKIFVPSPLGLGFQLVFIYVLVEIKYWNIFKSPQAVKLSNPILCYDVNPGLGQLDPTGDVTQVELDGLAAEDVETFVARIFKLLVQLVQLGLSFCQDQGKGGRLLREGHHWRPETQG